jgi:hypothetical protein
MNYICEYNSLQVSRLKMRENLFCEAIGGMHRVTVAKQRGSKVYREALLEI